MSASHPRSSTRCRSPCAAPAPRPNAPRLRRFSGSPSKPHPTSSQLPPRPGETLVELADCQVLPESPVEDLAKCGLAGVGAVAFHFSRQRTIGIVAAQIEFTEAVRQQFKPNVGMDQRLQMRMPIPRL